MDIADSGDDEEYVMVYNFKNCYIDCMLKNEKQLTEPFYIGNQKFIIIKHQIHNAYCDENKSIFYYIKNNANNIITYQQLYDQIDIQSIEYKHILEERDDIMIEFIDKETEIQYVMFCGS